MALEMLAETACALIGKDLDSKQAWHYAHKIVPIAMVMYNERRWSRLEFRTANLRNALLEYLKRVAFLFNTVEPMVSQINIRFRAACGSMVECEYDLDRLDLALQPVASSENIKTVRVTLAEIGGRGTFGLKFLGLNRAAMQLHPYLGTVHGPAVYVRVDVTDKGLYIISTDMDALKDAWVA